MFALWFGVLTVATAVVTSYAGSISENDLGTGEPYGYGYSGSFSGSGPPPNFAFPSFDFSGFLGNYLDSLSRYHQDFISKGGGAFSYSYASSSPSASARAHSSITFKNKIGLQNNIERGGYGQPGGFSGGYGGSFGGGTNGAYGGSFSGPGGSYSAPGGSYSGPGSYSYSSPNTGPHAYPETINFAQRGSFGGPGSGAASSSASIGPGGIQQSASVYPENPISPNVNTRFGAAPSGGGFRGVFTSSESRTSNVNGKPITVQRASTTVNDNGKVTTYTAKNP